MRRVKRACAFRVEREDGDVETGRVGTSRSVRSRGLPGIVTAMTPGRWTLRLDDLLLPGPNRLMRMHAQDYRKLRDTILLLARSTLEPNPPAAPLDACRIVVTLHRPARSLLDADAKYGAVKPLLDVLQPPRAYSRRLGGRTIRDVTSGLGLLRDDGDGEGMLTGCVRDLRVVQVIGPPRVEVEIESVDAPTP